MIITVFQSTSFYQIFNVMPIFIQQHVAPEVGGFRIPIPWYQSINAVFSIVAAPALLWLWGRQARRGRERDELAKIGIGAWIAAASNLIVVAAIIAYDGAPIHPIWPFLYSAGLGISFLYGKMQPAAFWAMHAAIATGGGLIVLLFGRRLTKALRPG
jgi:POT family proton-dependent oligopeptide transporter